MLDFKELKQDGLELEILIREILLTQGFKVQWSGKGQDGGKDLICYEERPSEFFADRKTWLIQCKHKAHSGGSVGIDDLDDIVDSCNQHEAKGYLLVCSTYPSSAVINRLEGITKNQSNGIDANYWDATIIEQKLSTPSLWRIAQVFFPKSSKNSTWQFYATENPNYWIVNFKGYHFHLSNRIGSKGTYHFQSIAQRIKDLEKIKLKKEHFIRIRAVYFDDKHGDYKYYLDYMFPSNEKPIIGSDEIAYLLGDGNSLEDGQYYTFDVISRPYHKYSDHYDKDHYDYYDPFVETFKAGFDREFKDKFKEGSLIPWPEIQGDTVSNKDISFNQIVDSFKSVNFIRLLRSINCDIENIDKFVNLRDWSELIEKNNINVDHFFSAFFLIEINASELEFLKLISYFPLEHECWFRLTKVYVHAPKPNGSGSEYDPSDNSLYELRINISPTSAHTKSLGREILNQYFIECCNAIQKFHQEKIATPRS
jgi:hypothetical protein